MNEETSQNPRTPEQTDTARPQGGPPRCVIVGMGASTGGLAAFETFFTPMPPDSGMAFVLVQHLAPDRASLLPELLAQYIRMPVQQATAALHVEPNHVYIIPPDATMTIATCMPQAIHGRAMCSSWWKWRIHPWRMTRKLKFLPMPVVRFQRCGSLI